jgi:hypothetical protein
MGLREITGYIAHALLLVYWLYMVTSTAPQIRKASRDRALAVRVILVKTAAVALTALLVGVIHFWATEVWHVIAAIVVAVAIAIPLRRAYRTMVAAPRHRLTLGKRARAIEKRPGLPYIPAVDGAARSDERWWPPSASVPRTHHGQAGSA